MKKIAIALVALLFVSLFTACDAAKQVPDGTYTIETNECDERGYRDFISFTFEDGQLIEMTADAISVKDDTLKSESEEIKEAMLAVTGTYPEKYYNDLVNQYIEKLDSSEIDVVAGATVSSEKFISLMAIAEKAVKSGNVESVITETDPE